MGRVNPSADNLTNSINIIRNYDFLDKGMASLIRVTVEKWDRRREPACCTNSTKLCPLLSFSSVLESDTVRIAILTMIYPTMGNSQLGKGAKQAGKPKPSKNNALCRL